MDTTDSVQPDQQCLKIDLNTLVSEQDSKTAADIISQQMFNEAIEINTQQERRQFRRKQKRKFDGFLENISKYLENRQAPLQNKFYTLLIFRYLEDRTQTRIVSLLNGNVLLAYMVNLANTLDPYLPIEQKGRTYFSSEPEWGNRFIRLVLECLVYWGERFVYNLHRDPSKFSQVYNSLIQHKVVIPTQFKYFKQLKRKQQHQSNKHQISIPTEKQKIYTQQKLKYQNELRFIKSKIDFYMIDMDNALDQNQLIAVIQKHRKKINQQILKNESIIDELIKTNNQNAINLFSKLQQYLEQQQQLYNTFITAKKDYHTYNQGLQIQVETIFAQNKQMKPLNKQLSPIIKAQQNHNNQLLTQDSRVEDKDFYNINLNTLVSQQDSKTAADIMSQQIMKTTKDPSTKQGKQQMREKQKTKVNIFLDNVNKYLENRQAPLQNKFYTLLIFRYLSDKTQRKILSLLSGNVLFAYMVNLANTLDPYLPIEKKGRNYFSSEPEWGNRFIRLVLECLVYWGEIFAQNKTNGGPSKFRQAYNSLIQHKVVIPSQFKYFKQLQREQQYLQYQSIRHQISIPTEKQKIYTQQQLKYQNELRYIKNKIDLYMTDLENASDQNQLIAVIQKHRKKINQQILKNESIIDELIKTNNQNAIKLFSKLQQYLEQQQQLYNTFITAKKDYHTYNQGLQIQVETIFAQNKQMKPLNKQLSPIIKAQQNHNNQLLTQHLI